MLNSPEGRVFVELNYPHIIGIRGYQRHHDVATWSGEIRPNSFKMHAAMPVSDICLPAPIVPNQASVQAFQFVAFKLTANHGEARAGTGSKP
jgi:hypothetical protein